MMSISDNLLNIRHQIPQEVTLVAVSKTKPVSCVEEAYRMGQRDFGENKAQELKDKYEVLPKDIKWHFIGHLQTNKVKYIVPFVYLIHGVDSYKLLMEINKQAKKVNRIIPCLLQFYIAQEETKFGFNLQECREMFDDIYFKNMQNVLIQGVMGMATHTDNQKQQHSEFKTLKNIFETLKQDYQLSQDFKIISMGMTEDYHIAIEEGTTMVRIGSAIFGVRQYSMN